MIIVNNQIDPLRHIDPHNGAIEGVLGDNDTAVGHEPKQLNNITEGGDGLASENVEAVIEAIRKQMEDGTILRFNFVRTMLKSMLHGARKMESHILDALTQDLKLDQSSAYLLSIYPFVNDAQAAFEKLRSW